MDLIRLLLSHFPLWFVFWPHSSQVMNTHNATVNLPSFINGNLLSNNTLDIISKDETQAKSHDIFLDNFDPSPWTKSDCSSPISPLWFVFWLHSSQLMNTHNATVNLPSFMPLSQKMSWQFWNLQLVIPSQVSEHIGDL